MISNEIIVNYKFVDLVLIVFPSKDMCTIQFFFENLIPSKVVCTIQKNKFQNLSTSNRILGP
jgi:hypothetical protein